MYLLVTLTIALALSSFLLAASAIKTKKEGLKVLLWVLFGFSFSGFAFLSLLLLMLRVAFRGAGYGAV